MKYAVYTKWVWPNGVPSAEEMQARHRAVKSLIVYPSEDAAIEEMAQRDAMRKETIDETGHKMVEETKGPFLSIMADV
ncbi:MAG: hypothetical protein EBW07_11705 [Rhodobacteraceae bacterium]|nr:hypothetical protein [Paracoccaceae bacterium]